MSHSEVKRVVYALKRLWGTPARIFRETVITDTQTGEHTPTTVASINITRAILLPRKITNDFAYDLSFIAANKNFTYGGFFNAQTRNIIIDAVDLPSTYTILAEDYIIINNKRYVISTADDYDEGAQVIAYLISAKHLEAQPNVV